MGTSGVEPNDPSNTNVREWFSTLEKCDFIRCRLFGDSSPVLCWISDHGLTDLGGRRSVFINASGQILDRVLHWESIVDFKIISRCVPEDMIRNYVRPTEVVLEQVVKLVRCHFAQSELSKVAVEDVLKNFRK